MTKILEKAAAVLAATLLAACASNGSGPDE